VSGFTTPQKWPAELTQKWKTTVGLGKWEGTVERQIQSTGRDRSSIPTPGTQKLTSSCQW
jgi:hypothetical protein